MKEGCEPKLANIVIRQVHRKGLSQETRKIHCTENMLEPSMVGRGIDEL